MAISQCPKCVLKFSSRAEMRWHLREDHPTAAPTEPEPESIPARRPDPWAGAPWWRFRWVRSRSTRG